MSYEDNVLIKLRRVYSKDETISAMDKKIRQLEFDNGQLLSEIDFLKNELNNEKKEDEKELIKTIQNHHMWKHQQKLVKERGETIKKLRIEIQRLSSEIIKLNNDNEYLKDKYIEAVDNFK